jgi:hypothetical protein
MRGKCYCDKTLRDMGEKVESEPTVNNDYLWSGHDCNVTIAMLFSFLNGASETRHFKISPNLLL